ncbi:MAG: DUF4388 domain-containing protein [Thermodesulfovibrio sp.]|nr:DUF4388 domain-containing protein [Thermodesulfovibrio sp.]
MKKLLGDIIDNLYREKKTGILNIAMLSEKNLFKFYFKNGEIYYLSYAFKKGKESLNELFHKELRSVNFIPDITIDIKSDDIPTTEEIIKKLKAANLYISIGNEIISSTNQFQKIRERLKIALIKQIGPIGNRVLDKIIQEKWNAQLPPTKNDILKLVELLTDEIEEKEGKNEFQTEVKRFIEEVFR